VNTIELKKMISAFLITKCAKTYPYDSVPETATLPYVTYRLASSFPDENQVMERFTLYVDCWDNKADTTALETLTGNIDGDGAMTNATGLHRKKYFVDGTLQATIYREGRAELDDEDPQIRRRQLRYEVHAYLT